jgi:putative ABC transport system permease protein
MGALVQDLRFALRVLMRHGPVTAAAVITLALGIGANTLMYGSVSHLVMRPFALPQVDRLVSLYQNHARRGPDRNEVTAADFLDWRGRAKSFQRLSAQVWWDAALSGAGPPEQLAGRRVNADWFHTIGMRPRLGRDFHEAEDRPGAAPVVVLSDGLWRRRFGADPGVLGRSITLNGVPRQVVGIMPPEASYPTGTELWAPLALTPEESEDRGHHYLLVVGRLHDGVKVEQARAEIRALAAMQRERYPTTNEGWDASLYPLVEDAVREIKPLLYVLFGAAAFVLLIACVNVANLLLARGALRSREIAIRTTVGASRRRIVRQLLTESVLLAMLGGGAGVLIALWGTDLLRAAFPADMTRFIPGWAGMRVDPAALGFALALSIGTGLLFGVVPSLHATRPDLVESLKDGGSAGRGGHGLRSALVVAETALALVLLAGTGLMVRSFWKLREANPGFDAAGALTLRVSLPEARYGDSTRVIAYYRAAVERLRALPGVTEVGAVSHLPLGGSNASRGYYIAGREPQSPAERRSGRYRRATPGYFAALGIPIRRGRAFDEGDREEAARAAVINEDLAAREFPDRDPLGQRLVYSGTEFEIVGVAGNVKHRSLAEDASPEFYLPQWQWPSPSMALVVRTSGDPADLAESARRAMQEVDPDQPVFAVMTMSQVLDSAGLLGQRVTSSFFGAFALIALALAATGIFGVMSFTVAQRTREIGVRMALGAGGGDVMRMVVSHGLRLTLIGLAIGLAATWGLSRVMQGLLFQVSATDPGTFAATALLLAAVATAACWLPAWRATRVDPVVALRSE